MFSIKTNKKMYFITVQSSCILKFKKKSQILNKSYRKSLGHTSLRHQINTVCIKTVDALKMLEHISQKTSASPIVFQCCLRLLFKYSSLTKEKHIFIERIYSRFRFLKQFIYHPTKYVIRTCHHAKCYTEKAKF